MSASEDLPEMLLKVFEYNPRQITPPRSHYYNHPQFCVTLPFNFYDRHLAPQLSLKRVVIDPSLPRSLSDHIDTTLEQLRSDGHKIIPVGTTGDVIYPGFTARNELYGKPTMETLADQYQASVGHFAAHFISTWAIHPTASEYFPTLAFCHRKSGFPSYKDSVHSQDSLRFQLPINQRVEVLSSLPDRLKDALETLEYRDLVIYQFYEMSEQMEQVFKDMDSLEADLPCAAYKTVGGLGERKAECQPIPYDAINAPWNITRCPVQTTGKHATILQIGDKNLDVVPPSCLRVSETKFDRMDSLTAAGLCYHAWHQAVIEDATIIVFHCGNYERIGVRHRGSQTLILSSLIEVSKCQDPEYGKIHMGLMLAAVNDTLDRHEQSYHLQAQPVPVPCSEKRKRRTIEPTELRRSKRQKVKVQMSSLSPRTVKDEKDFWKAYTHCPIALVRFDFDILRSPSPAACLRHGGPLSPHGVEMGTTIWKTPYEPFECCTLTLDSDLTRGGTGLIHTARLELRTADGTTHSKDVVVKSAVDPYLRDRVRREYRAYHHLWEHKVDRIPMVYGLFEDVEDMVTLLVIEKFAMSFRDREPFDYEANGKLLSISQAERTLCLRTIRAMHKAGVAHMDLRAENIMVGHDGLPVIIDFDRSWVGVEKWVTDKEIRFSQELLDGNSADAFPVAIDSDEEFL
ncbi:hypothetical protein BDN72DRAFT_898677 [Pluteus cervinus]|uniref:Uncharacterized protein n=1 Tax=Pluteus cervinus TaxID=181527 RepID=A0ACD3AR26_9AGAR|nr:hypothetical protein BDN72DRAFT_898677 [Pluteus cervinus]